VVIDPDLDTAGSVDAKIISNASSKTLLEAGIKETVGDADVSVWTTKITRTKAPAVCSLLSQGRLIPLADLVRNPDDRTGTLKCLPLVIEKLPRIFPSG
jgi:hypothetical protein